MEKKNLDLEGFMLPVKDSNMVSFVTKYTLLKIKVL